MAVTANMLTVKRPTPTTVLYTVSTRTPQTTLQARIFAYLLVFVRFLVGGLVFAALFGELQLFLSSSIHWLLDASSILPEATTLPWRLTLYTILLALTLHRNYTSESLLVIRGLGVQTTASSSSYLWSGSTRFIPTAKVQDIWIHEAFRGFEVRYYLAVVVEGEEDVVVVFPSILPRREVLEEVWRGVRGCLYEGKG